MVEVSQGDIDVEHWNSPTCFNGVDDNGDGLVDAENDSCVNWYDNEEDNDALGCLG